MKKYTKKLMICLLALALLGGQLVLSAAASTGEQPPEEQARQTQLEQRLAAGQEAAWELYELGLFRGVGVLEDGSPDFGLERQATRGEAVTMLVRLLGMEETALRVRYAHPFADALWAGDYVGYAYYAGISTGVSDTEFGTGNTIDRDQFLTLMLRAMGYGQVDWRDPTPTADQAGLDYSEGEGFCRADMASICRSALDCPLAGGGRTLKETLEELGAFDGGKGGPAGPLFTAGPVQARVDAITVSGAGELIPQLAAAQLGRAKNVLVRVPAGQEELYNTYLGQGVSALSDIQRINISWSPGTGEMRTELFYGDAAEIMAWMEGKRESISQENLLTLNTAKEVHDSLVEEGMSQYEQVKAFHDHLVNFNTYKDTGDRSHRAAGALVDGYAVCDGYSLAFDLLCYLSGIECIRVCGTADGGGHAWNKVLLDGAWYNVDVTWDDPISSRPILRYDYFLVSDQTLSRTHQWTAYGHWPAAGADY